MWHLKTKLGTFWLVESEGTESKKFLFGVDDHELGTYTDVAAAAKDVYQQATGFLQWDSQSKVRAPTNIEQWNTGLPEGW